MRQQCTPIKLVKLSFVLDKGLGELYEEEYVKAARPDGDVLEERDAATKAEARTLLKVGLGFRGWQAHPAEAGLASIERAEQVMHVHGCRSMLSMSVG